MPDLGIGEAVTAGLTALGAGESAGAISSVLAPALIGGAGGAALGGVEGAVTGGNVGQDILHGAEGGALTGGGIGLGGNLLGSSIGAVGADALGGAAGGALGGKLTGGNPLTGALEGGVSGGIAGALSGAPASTGAAPAGGGPGAGAGGLAPPPGITPDTGLPNFDTSSLDNTVKGLQNTGSISTSVPESSVGQSFEGTSVPGEINTGSLSSVGSSLTNSSNVGSGTVGSQNLSSGIGSGLTPQFAQGIGGAPSLNSGGIDALASGGAGSSSLASAASEAAKAPTSFDNFLDKPRVGTAFDVVKANPGAAISAAGLGLDALKGNQVSGAEKNLQAEAGGLAGQGQQLEGYLQSGNLPPGLQQGITQASDSAKATIRSQYAARGMSGSSAEQQDLAAVDERAQAQGAQMAMQLLQTGISETGMASGLYEQLLNQNLANDKGLSSAIANFATAASGGGQSGRGGVTINYPGAAA